MKIKTTGESMRNKIIGILGFVLAGLFLSGCATPGKPFQLVQPIPADKGILYVYANSHNNTFSEVLINDAAVGGLWSKKYLVLQCKPGPLTVSTGWFEKIYSLDINIEPGSQSFVMATTGTTIPKLVPEQEALGQIQKKNLAELNHGLVAKLTKSDMPAGTDLTAFKKLYVDVGEKGWKTPPFIVSGLSARGYVVTSGPAENMPADTDCLVKLKEKWFWDLKMYLLRLDVSLVNPQTKAVYATATVERAEPQGRLGPKVLAAEALNAMFNNFWPAGVEAVR
jgi:hypothetical protein